MPEQHLREYGTALCNNDSHSELPNRASNPDWVAWRGAASLAFHRVRPTLSAFDRYCSVPGRVLAKLYQMYSCGVKSLVTILLETGEEDDKAGRTLAKYRMGFLRWIQHGLHLYGVPRRSSHTRGTVPSIDPPRPLSH